MGRPASICVTGASGFVGRALCGALVLRGYPVLACSRRGMTPMPGVETVTLADYAQAPMADALVHLAEPADLAGIVAEQAEAVAGEAIRVAEALAGRGYRRLLYLSSAAVYGDMERHPRRTDEAVSAYNSYTGMKLAGERAMLAGGGVAVRLSNIYGPGLKPGTVIADIMAQRHAPGPLTVRDAAPVRDFLWLEDAVAGLTAMLEGKASGLFNLGFGESASVGDISRICLDLWGRKGEEVISTTPSGRESVLRLDISRTTDSFGWHPAVSLLDGLARLCAAEAAA
ncbi:MAG: NAD(P)-dependent oxidoreductase [Oceanibaculum nanhaiense]|uniref:NAD-dependent epimerase/dehydratase family protein n=1 Tax=Oceanibaculum nanhaiense TaxID=1909734 RepID=UPI0025A3E127|nr:NAD(P)-dependent oxidoreductase [Oceanibaculum nanhaiense]MDM7947758.1 NAD(P)-dependent oxidoreductase [Oceanibaculum nanhaiense]